jgi:hypothetical protein
MLIIHYSLLLVNFLKGELELFTKPIFNTTLTGETADRLFSNITATGALDKSFLATLRVLLHKRMKDDVPVKLHCKPLYFSELEIESRTTTQQMNWFIPDYIKYPNTSEHSIVIVHTTNPVTGTKMLEIIRANAGTGKRHLKEYSLCEDLRVFYARKLNALFYHSESNKTTVIFTDKLEPKQFHALQMMIPKYLPELFKDNPLTESETALLKSCGNKSAVEYEKLIEEFAHSLDIRAEIIRSKLSGFETAFERQRITEIQNDIKVIEQNYQIHLSTLRDLTAQIENKKYTLAGLECHVVHQSGDSELVEYFMCNKRLSIIQVTGTTIEFVAHGYADIYDEDAFEKFVGNHGSYMYSCKNSAFTKPQMEKLYRAIFDDCRFKLRICAAYTADMRTGLKPKQYYTFPPESSTYLPNPHIHQYGCIGSYSMRFQEYMKNRDYVGAIDQAVVSARNLNFFDAPVMTTFANQLFHSDVTCIEKQDGILITPKEAIKELEELCQDQSQ